MFEAAWSANTGALNGGVVPVVQYEGLPIADTSFPPRNAQWARITIQHASAESSGFGDGAYRVEKVGTLTVQVFASLELDDPVLRCGQLSEVVRVAFEAQHTASDVRFRRVRIEEGGVDSAWYRADVLAEFVYN